MVLRLSLFLCVRGKAFVCIVCFLAAKYWPASRIDTGPLAIAAAPLFTWSATIEQYSSCCVSHTTVLYVLDQHSGYSWYAALQNTWSIVRCMKCWGSFGTGYCCGCIGVFWLSIKANVYVQYQKETRTSKIWISTTPRHQASVGKKISTSNQNLKIFFFQGESEIFGTLQCTVVTWKTTLLLVIVSALHLYLYFSYLYLWVGVFLGSLGAPPLPTEKLLISGVNSLNTPPAQGIPEDRSLRI